MWWSWRYYCWHRQLLSWFSSMNSFINLAWRKSRTSLHWCKRWWRHFIKGVKYIFKFMVPTQKVNIIKWNIKSECHFIANLMKAPLWDDEIELFWLFSLLDTWPSSSCFAISVNLQQIYFSISFECFQFLTTSTASLTWTRELWVIAKQKQF